MMRLLAAVVLSLVIIAPAAKSQSRPESTEVTESMANETSESSASVVNFHKQIQPVFDKRCVVCHGCYDAPCQLKLGSYEGITRGANKAPVYDGARVLAAEPTRLFEDAQTVKQWREMDFHPVLNENSQEPDRDSINSLLVKMLEQKRAHPLPDSKQLPDSFKLSLNRSLVCPTADEHEKYQKKNPLWGMPYALPAISQSEQQRIIDWVAAGSPVKQKPALSKPLQQQINQWERYFNQDSNKSQLVNRYLYEHLFLAHLYFPEVENNNTQPQFFRIYRSATPPGEPIKIIATRRPFDDPEVSRVYYRLVPLQETLVDKLHMPFALTKARKQKWHTWFYQPDYPVDELPGYEAENASNPFITFAALPTKARYRFMIDEAQYSIMQFIKGAVCRGQIALNVINDHFWVVFANPDLDLPEYDEVFMEKARSTITLPAEANSNALPTNWVAYARAERKYLDAKAEYIKKHFKDQVPVTLDLLWDGDDNNDNVALTIFRHFDAASVVKGLVGEKPQTAWVITYPLFERIHYLLVAGYDVYGNVGHQLNSRMYMDFLRMEGETSFLSLLPKNSRNEVREQWYRGSVSPVEKYIQKGSNFAPQTDIKYKTADPLTELLAMVKDHVNKAQSETHLVYPGLAKQAEAEIKALNQTTGIAASILPQASLVLIQGNDNKSYIYSLLSHNAYSNISHIFAEKSRRRPEEDTMILAHGVMTSHPNALFRVAHNEISEFTASIRQLNNEADYAKLLDKFGIRRTSDDFWSFSDELHNTYQQRAAIKFGYFDYNRLENR
ncbi:fatty acid cis/trans isomerase [Thalassotalea mangrovi]|uniref:9-hexadecenoic acid cis-trans isomerase n=1 Tax=Thalassotalea mangrovi TaxID=2572245 RepID=A0A4U1B9M0_9GAMM|nr:fatty acid cis/trans isomerase [Thalassotalea mangrovi]TKB47477.1 9-hexadecenoic acid cis-trans isomerase [Thalassotalea mangrovi]